MVGTRVGSNLRMRKQNTKTTVPLGPVVRSLVSVNRWLRGIKTYRFPWYLTLVSANHASSNPGLDVMPERRTERFLMRFWPVGRFFELWFRYLSSPTGREGEISRPLDHMRQIPFIHSARVIDSTNFYIYRTVFQLFSPCGQVCRDVF